MINLTSSEMLSIINQGLSRTKKQRNILIVGAGISGLVTASLLKKAGHNITLAAFAVLEPEQESELYPDVYLPEGRIHFAGEHTSLTNGWIEGAIESGIRAAWEINSSN